LKSDIVLENFATREDNILKESVATKAIEEKRERSFYITKVDPIALTFQSKDAIGLPNGNVVKRFDVSKYNYSEVESWMELVLGSFKPDAVCVYSNPYMSITTPRKSIKLDLRTVDRNSMEKLVAKNIVYKLSATEYLFKANGWFVVEVL